MTVQACERVGYALASERGAGFSPLQRVFACDADAAWRPRSTNRGCRKGSGRQEGVEGSSPMSPRERSTA